MSDSGKESEAEVCSAWMLHSQLKDQHSDALTLLPGKAEATSYYWTR